ncbi:MAG TPA: aminoacyl-tRNA hydrolase [Candidatus Limnocylindrales bacterium]|nr:aminoacyl-tRNA hydrolase [Candidatus Limnocylindrales bacterium]
MTAEPRFCVAGLGNPGEEYRQTRHNVGFQVADVIAARTGSDIRRPEYGALTARAMLGRSMVLVMKPQTYMNASGPAVAAALQDLGLPAASLIAIYDDLDLPLGRLRIRPEGGAGGHRGMASIIEHLGTTDFARVRVGIGRPAEGREVLEHVLSPFDADERELAAQAIEAAADAACHIVTNGIIPAMEAFNGR